MKNKTLVQVIAAAVGKIVFAEAKDKNSVIASVKSEIVSFGIAPKSAKVILDNILKEVEREYQSLCS